MQAEIRKMLPNEANTVWKLGLVTFHSMEGIFMGKPKNAMVAVVDERIVGGVTYTTYQYQGGLLGYVDYAFVDHKYHGQGIGTKLYTATVDQLKKLGCTQIFGLVRGDNPGSFMLFEKQKMERSTLKEIKRLLGISGLLRLLFTTTLSWGPTMDCYLSNAKKRRDGMDQFFWYLFVNLAILLLGIFMHKDHLPLALAAAATVMAAGTLFGASIKLLHRKQYQFRLSIGGGFVTAIVAAVGGFFPMCGKWYPKQFDTTKDQKRELGISAMIEWIGILGMYVVIKKVLPQTGYWDYVSYYCTSMSIFRMIPSFPFDEYGARRVYQYNKWLYGALWIISGCTLYFI